MYVNILIYKVISTTKRLIIYRGITQAIVKNIRLGLTNILAIMKVGIFLQILFP